MKLLLVLPLVLLCGCSTVQNNAPKRIAFEDKLAANLIKKYSKPDAIPADTVGEVERNRILNDFLFLTDLNYNNFIQGLYQGRATFDTATDLALIGIGGAGALASGAATKSILAVISAGVAGSRVSIDKNFFAQQSTAALIATMEASRKNVLAQLQESMALSSADFPLSLGIMQIGEYYRAGTLVGAVQNITMAAGNERAAATEKIRGAMLKRKK